MRSDQKTTSVLEHLRAYVSTKAADATPGYVADMRRDITAAIVRQRWRSPADITPASAREYLARLAGEGKGAKTRNLIRSYLHGFCEFLIDEGCLEANPLKRVKPARVLSKQSRYVPTDAQVIALIEHARRYPKSKKDRWLVYLTAALAGLRRGTIQRLTWAHVRLDDRPRFELDAKILKSRKPKIVFMPAELADALREHQRTSGTRERVFVGVPKDEGFNRDAAAAGIPKVDVSHADKPTFSFHSLRHYHSNRLARLGFSDSERAAQNTHDTLAMTTTIYTDSEKIGIQRKVFALPRLLGGEPEEDPPGAGASLDFCAPIADDVPSEVTMQTTTPQLGQQSAAPMPGLGRFATSESATRKGLRIPGRIGPGKIGDTSGTGSPGRQNEVGGSNPPTPILEPATLEALKALARLGLRSIQSVIDDSPDRGGRSHV